MLALLKLHNRPGPAQLQCSFDLGRLGIFGIFGVFFFAHKQAQSGKCICNDGCPMNVQAARIDGTGRTHIETGSFLSFRLAHC